MSKTADKTSKKSSNRNIPQAPKGMRDLIGEEFFLFQGFFEKAAEIALYYGFKPIETPILEKVEIFSRGVGPGTDIVDKEMYSFKPRGGDRLTMRPEYTAPVMRAYLEHGLQFWPQPVMLYYYGPCFRHDNPQRGRYRQFYQFGLEILDTPKSIGDAMIIRILTTILSEAGIPEITLQINSLGDHVCRPIYKKELTNYYRKNTRNICADCRERLKTNPLRVLDCKNPACQDIKRAAPDAISFLCPDCKTHFKEVLEYLDAMGINYEINNSIVRGLDYYSRTVFELISNISSKDASGEGALEQPLALGGGGRYDYLAKSLGIKKDVPSVGGSLGVDRIIALNQYVKHAPRIVKRPKVFFIQLSYDAKLRSFEIIDILRKARIPVTHSISKDSLSAQLAIAEKTQIPYTIILGQKEAMEGTVIIRNMDTRSQDTVPIAALAEYLKKMM